MKQIALALAVALAAVGCMKNNSDSQKRSEEKAKEGIEVERTVDGLAVLVPEQKLQEAMTAIETVDVEYALGTVFVGRPRLSLEGDKMILKDRASATVAGSGQIFGIDAEILVSGLRYDPKTMEVWVSEVEVSKLTFEPALPSIGAGMVEAGVAKVLTVYVQQFPIYTFERSPLEMVGSEVPGASLAEVKSLAVQDGRLRLVLGWR